MPAVNVSVCSCARWFGSIWHTCTDQTYAEHCSPAIDGQPGSVLHHTDLFIRRNIDDMVFGGKLQVLIFHLHLPSTRHAEPWGHPLKHFYQGRQSALRGLFRDVVHPHSGLISGSCSQNSTAT